MADRVLRWLSAISLVLLALDAAWNIGRLPMFAAHFPIVIGWGPAFVLGYLLLPATVTAICEVTAVATLVVSLQRKQLGWVVGTLLCLIVHFYAGLLLAVPGGLNGLYKLAGSSYSVATYMTLYYILVFTPIVVLAFVYAWTRRQPPNGVAAAGDAAATHL